MSESKCEHPDLRAKNGKCSDELIEKCHGKVKTHPCEPKDCEKEKE
jgi:hypothetical protein